MSDYTQGNGCCTTCNGTGASCDPETSGLCWDCRGTGHAHYGPCEQEVLASAWPVLSAGLRELHPTVPRPGGVLVCHTCLTTYVCVTAKELDRIDQELGIGDDHQSGDPS